MAPRTCFSCGCGNRQLSASGRHCPASGCETGVKGRSPVSCNAEDFPGVGRALRARRVGSRAPALFAARGAAGPPQTGRAGNRNAPGVKRNGCGRGRAAGSPRRSRRWAPVWEFALSGRLAPRECSRLAHTLREGVRWRRGRSGITQWLCAAARAPRGWPMVFRTSPNHGTCTSKALPPLMRGNSIARSASPFSSSCPITPLSRRRAQSTA